MKDLRVLFMGTPEFSVYVLNHLIEKHYLIAAVITAPDKPSGRGQKIRESAVKKYAKNKNLKILQPENLKADRFQKELEIVQPDVAVVVAFRMLPEKVWNFPKLGTFNLHASLLPQYRGAAPINWAIIKGESKTGVTTFFLDHNIDTGKIIAQEEVEITPSDNAGTLHDKLMIQGASLVDQTLQQISEGTVETQKQTETENLNLAPKLDKDNTRINWNQTSKEIDRFIRGLYPYPIAWTILKNEKDKLRCKIFKAHPIQEKHSFKTGQIFSTKTEFRVAVSDGFISVEEMQLPGKKRMPIKDLLNGLPLSDKAQMQ